jgi:hypothetical protein
MIHRYSPLFLLPFVTQSPYHLSAMDFHQKPILLSAPSPDDLVVICDVLNSKEIPSARLRQLVAAWHKSGPNLQRMIAADETLKLALERACRVVYRATPSGRADLELCIDPLTFEILVAATSASIPTRSQERNVQRQAALRVEQEAIRLFVSLTLNPAWEKLGGPCARCGRYYVKRRVSQKVYCSRRCGNTATAIVRTAAQRAEERKKKLSVARKFIRQWRRSSGVGWKEFVSDKTGLTFKWLTRAVNQGELRLPRAESQFYQRK